MEDSYRSFAEALAYKAGELMRQNFSLGMQREWKDNNTPLTVTDTTINQMVIDAVRATYPEHSVVAEEGSDLRESEYVWVCDPIDGTVPFSHGMPTSTFSLALVQNGESILGVAYDPYLERLFYAEKGKGAFLNGEPIHVSSQSSLEASVIGTEITAAGPTNAGPNLTQLPRLLTVEKAKVIRLHSMVYTAAMVAAGELVGVYFGGANPWDMASVKIIVEEAGGKVTDLYGEEQRYDQDIKGAVVSNGILHEKLLALARQAENEAN